MHFCCHGGDRAFCSALHIPGERVHRLYIRPQQPLRPTAGDSGLSGADVASPTDAQDYISLWTCLKPCAKPIFTYK